MQHEPAQPARTSPSVGSAGDDKEKLQLAAEANVVAYPASVDGVHAHDLDPDAAYVSRYGGALAVLFAAGVEARGIERVPEHMREKKNTWNNLLMWFSVNAVLTTVPIGVLGQSIFTLTLPHAIAVILTFGALGAACTAFISTLGPKTGLRTMIITRYSSGYVGGIIYSVLNILTQVGFSVTAVILGGQTLASVNPGTLPLVVGIIIVGVLSLIPCFVGYNLVHHYERYAWLVTFVVFIMLYALGGKAGYDVGAQKALEDTGVNYTADILSFGGIVFGSFTGWAPVAADYNCKLPVDTPAIKVFILTFFGLMIPICFVEILGAALMTITDPAYVAAFASGSGSNTGALLAQTLTPWHGFGKFILVLLALSVIANNIPNTYSAGLCAQALGKPFAKVPRFAWTVLAFVAYTVAGVAGREHFSAFLTNFLAVLSYWTAFFVVITFEEHVFFRRGGRGYNLADYDTPSRLPMGFAGVFAMAAGVAGAVVGMAQVWYVGPIASKIGTFGGDLGFELAAIFAGVVFPPLRYLEIRLTGR